MTLEEMKLAVCEKLPELIDTHDGFWWKTKRCQSAVRWPTEGLQVCHEAEGLLVSFTDCNKYEVAISRIVRGEWFCQKLWKATYEQRLEALCWVWFPERFNTQNT